MGALSLQLVLHLHKGKLQGLQMEHAVPAGAIPLPPEHGLYQHLQQYFAHAGECRWPLADLPGTAFQQRVWQALLRIPAGETRSYGVLAAELGSSAQAVGNACRSNPVPIVIPCHRVVAVNGMGGYAGATAGYKMQIKRWLLQHEGVSR